MAAKAGGARVLVAKGLVGGDDGHARQFLTLVDPRTGLPACYLLAGGCLQELNWFKQQYSSWLVGDSVVADGGMYLGTPVDPLLLLMPLLEKARAQQNVFQDLEQIVSMADSPSAHLLAELLAGSGQLACLCDVKQAGGQTYYRLNDDLVLAWLRLKVDQAKQWLLESPAAAFSGMDDLGLTAYVSGLLGEYLAQHWQERLAQALDLPEEMPQPAHPPPSSDWDAPPTEKKVRLDPKEAAKLKAAESRQANKQAKLAKEASGMRKLSSFFAPRPK
ncbi:ribonuclease H2 subunit B [Micractinium conductrix]|uniref:Ribonuclease H2 subunit B n=1 Tax=Micractinium conductrix TaxID=554055 RepID=A0A2P6V2U9_9CHLO|nr:ribonuclease H2 subunit B [Micractinium conductrix]|eukprot:PSC68408.1 ribonuclease H2 subunit B [Micractinium conductrix]